MTVTCPYCAEEIQPAAIVCPHCRKSLKKPASLFLRAFQIGLVAGLLLGAYDVLLTNNIPAEFAAQGSAGYIGWFLSGFTVNFLIFFTVGFVLIWLVRKLSK